MTIWSASPSDIIAHVERRAKSSRIGESLLFCGGDSGLGIKACRRGSGGCVFAFIRGAASSWERSGFLMRESFDHPFYEFKKLTESEIPVFKTRCARSPRAR